jgi:hypothetical protein
VAGTAEDLKRRAEATYYDAKGAVVGTAKDVERRGEGTYYDAKGAVVGTADDIKRRADATYYDAKGSAIETKEEAKAGWFSWLGWGKAKANNAADEAVAEKDSLKRKAAGEVEDKAVGVAGWAADKKAETRR